ncbi:MAG: chromosomal replication initiator protein DnaA [Thermodesulfobacteriota bacterium]|nr:chromosomal replication initiator protein DnaA [Thermodesulfobacteriota bacterium]
MPRKKEIWQRITTGLQSHLSKLEFNTWFSHTILTKIDQNIAVIEVPNKFVAKWLSENYLGQIRYLFKDELGFLPDIHFICSSQTNTQNTLESNERFQKSEAAFSPHLNPLWTFASFVTANSNIFACSSALEVAKKPAHHYNPLYIFSKLSLGKTHLLNAIGNLILCNNPSTKVMYVSADQFSSDFSLAKKNRKINEFRDNYRNLDLLLFDDIHLLGGRHKSQIELISLLNSFFKSKKQIVVAGKEPASRIHNLLSQLKSRLQWGLLSEIHVPDQETKVRIIRQLAKQKNLNIPDDVTFFLANTANEVKTLIQYLVSLETHASLYHRGIDISTAKSIIRNRHRISLQGIQKLTAEYFNIALSDLLSSNRKQTFCYPRQMAMYLSRRLTDLSLKEIGQGFGNKDHSTVIYAVKRIEKDKYQKKGVRDDINKLHNFLLCGLALS